MKFRDITDFTCKHIVSEPGDATRYDFLVIEYYGDYKIVPYESTFKFPSYIDSIYVKSIVTIEDSIKTIDQNDAFSEVNPWTLLEVCTAIRELKNT